MKFNEKLKLLRSEKQLSQKQVAEALNVSTRTYSHYESGDREPSINVLIKLCDFFDVSADYLIGRSDDY